MPTRQELIICTVDYSYVELSTAERIIAGRHLARILGSTECIRSGTEFNPLHSYCVSLS
jgi:hypothetical protein